MSNVTEIFPTTPLAPVKFEGGWALGRKGSDILTFDDNGQPFPTRDAARKASKEITERVQRDRAAFEAAASAADVIADESIPEAPTDTDNSPASNGPTISEGTETLEAAQAKIEELTKALAAAQAQADTAAADGVAEEVIVITPKPIALPVSENRRASHYERQDMGQAHHATAVDPTKRVMYPPYAWNGEAHHAIAAALAAAGFVPGDEILSDDLACVPGHQADQARWNSAPSRNTARHRMANAGMIERVAGGRRGHTYILTADFFNPEVWEARAAAQQVGVVPAVTTA